MNNGLAARLVVIVAALIAFMVWRAAERHHQDGCGNDCPTDLSAARRK